MGNDRTGGIGRKTRVSPPVVSFSRDFSPSSEPPQPIIQNELRAVIYARFSCDKQRDASIDDQVAACTEYCGRMGYDVVGVYPDYALSGRSDDRPQFLRMVDDAKKGLFDVVVVWKVDRFARNMMDQYHYERELSLSGVTLESCKENIAGNTIEADMNKGMLALFAQIRSQQSAVDTMRGMVGKAEKCQYLGVPRFGYSHEGDEITLDPVWAPVARRIHTDYLAGVSIEYLARELRDMGATTTRGTEPDYEFVLGILKSTAYAGVYQWGRKRDDRGRVVTDENGDPVPLVYKEGGMPAIVDMDTKMACLRRIGQRKRYAAKADYILVGKLSNAETGAPMHGETARGRSGRQYFYYVDKSGGKRVSVRKDAIEAALAEAVRSLLSDKAVTARLVARAASFKREADKSADMALRAARDDLAALERKRANVIDAIADGAPLDGFREKLESINASIERAKARIAKEDDAGRGDYEERMAAFLASSKFANLPDEKIISMFVGSAAYFDGRAAAILNFTRDSGDAAEVREILIGEMKKSNPRSDLGFDNYGSGSPGRIRTYNPSVNSRMLCR